MDFEEQLSKTILSGQGERTFIDKVMSKEDVEAIRDLMRKEKLTRSELLELLYRIAANEAKLINLGAHERYLLLKFYVWIREFVKVAEQLYDYKETIEKLTEDKILLMPEYGNKLIENNIQLIEHNIKFLVDLYLNICRTSLSLGMSGFKEVLTNKYEVMYPNQPNMPQEAHKGGILSFKS